MSDELNAFLTERNALFCNPRAREARLFLERHGAPPPETPYEPLAIVHKARLQWLDATDAMLAESIAWLTARGYLTSWRGAPPLTPERRDADRATHGKPPLAQGDPL